MLEGARQRMAALLRAGADHLASVGPEAADDQLTFFFEALAYGSRELIGQLPLDENNYLRVFGPAHTDCRAVFMYSVLDELAKAGVSILQWRDWLGEEDFTPGNDKPYARRSYRLVVTATLETQALRIRRLTEALVDLLGFKTTNRQDYFRYYLLLRDIDGRVSASRDLEYFWSAPSGNLRYGIEMSLEQAREVESRLDLDRAWFRHGQAPLQGVETLRPGRLLASLRQRFIYALEHADDEEVMQLRMSYGSGYGSQSREIHFRPDAGRWWRQNRNEVRSRAGMIGLLGVHLLLLVQNLTELDGGPRIAALRSAFESGEITPPRIVERSRDPGIEPGDLVVTSFRALAEVTNVVESSFGFKSCAIRYLADAPLEDVDTETLPATDVVRVFRPDLNARESLQELLEQGLLDQATVDEIAQAPEDRWRSSLRSSYAYAWQHAGLREYVLSQLLRDEDRGSPGST